MSMLQFKLSHINLNRINFNRIIKSNENLKTIERSSKHPHFEIKSQSRAIHLYELFTFLCEAMTLISANFSNMVELKAKLRL